jgi:hypothetical protein
VARFRGDSRMGGEPTATTSLTAAGSRRTFGGLRCRAPA